MTTYNTNLASEFYVLSMLHRFGCEAGLTLGSKKSVEIVVVRESGDVATIDVKGLSGTISWPVDIVKKVADANFLVFISFYSPGGLRCSVQTTRAVCVPIAEWKTTRPTVVPHAQRRKTVHGGMGVDKMNG